MGRLGENAVLSIKNRSFNVTAQVEVSGDPAEGVLLSQGGYLGGWSFYIDGGKLKFAYNFVGLSTTVITSGDLIPHGPRQLRAEFAYDGGGFGKGGELTLFVDGISVGSGRIDATQPIVFSADESSDVGTTTGTPVTSDRGAGCSFTGSVEWIRIDIGSDDHSHLIPLEDAVRSAIGRQ
ncbi:hypothetical protein [Leucobacter sp. G161]|uniref:hypothetical protein n=1 Tax=Leucobacter sp. G161 TaxID=663704 RepID=UPI00073B17B2|nr:hypothetical protein [Leucobacter sp. G161]KUF06675.1 hypothetical protein AUL38_11650 [Leucobacter sp. G161]